MSRKTTPNVLLINCDDLGYGDLGCYGSTRNETPTIDALAQGGIRFTDAYCASPVCSPSRASMLTGCYPPRLSFNRVLFPGDEKGLNPDEFTLGALFKEHGYATACIGKWHVGDQKEYLPLNFGFDSYFGLPYSNDMGIQAGEEVWWKTPPLPLIEDDEVIQEQPSQSGLTERYVEKSVSFIRENADRPWFLYLAHMHVHLPLYAGERFMKESKNGDYGACVAEIDWSLAVLLHELERLGLEEDTLIIFTSDNGARGDHGGSNLPLRGGKFSSYEGGQRIALIAYWKGRIEGGRLCDGIVSHIDFLPTFADLLGYNLEGKKPIDGVSIKDVLFDSTPSTRDEFVYWGFDMKNNAYLNAIRVGRWKLHRGKWDPAGNQQTIELYDLETDEAESKECSADHPETVTELQYRLSRWEEELGNAYTNTIGREPRPSGFAANPVTLTTYDENHPYIIAMYDKGDRG